MSLHVCLTLLDIIQSLYLSSRISHITRYSLLAFSTRVSIILNAYVHIFA